MQDYTVRKLTGNYDVTESVKEFFYACARSHSEILGLKYDIEKFSLDEYARHSHVWFCFKGEKPVGFMLAVMGGTSLDSKHITLRQTFLYGLPGTRASAYLLKEFVDFGKRHANDVIITVGKKTNLKSRSLERLGFFEWETIHKLEV
jgi:hypothetical protein